MATKAKKKASASKPKKRPAKKPAAKKPATKKPASKSRNGAAKSISLRSQSGRLAKPTHKAEHFPALTTPVRKVPKVELSRGKHPIKLHHRPPTAKELEDLRKKLLARRSQLLGDVTAMESEAFSDATREVSVNHIADSSANQYEQDFTLHMIENETDELRMIEHALNKIVKKQNYGRCESCDIWISIERLRAKPHARICIHCIEKFEREGGGEHFGIEPANKKY
ncbi:MAG: TraR/DksA family transcriptional regulator [Planctomycetaceae bacterium]|nr:TraR/DksA family transcriptional regulator [Planctomycetaceae bacterium]